MNPELAAQAAMSLNLVTLIVLGVWWFIPWSRGHSMVEALAPLVVVHAGRTVALQLFSAQQNGYAVSDSVRDQIVWGDQAGALLAILTLLALWLKPVFAKPLAWLLVVATVVDLGNALVVGLRDDLLGQATDVSWLILTFYVPTLWVSIGLIGWLLVTRNQETWASKGKEGT